MQRVRTMDVDCPLGMKPHHGLDTGRNGDLVREPGGAGRSRNSTTRERKVMGLSDRVGSATTTQWKTAAKNRRDSLPWLGSDPDRGYQAALRGKGEAFFAYDLNTNSDQAGAGSPSFTRVARPDVAAVPGPLPLLGAAACFGYSRRLKKRINGRVPSKTYRNQTN